MSLSVTIPIGSFDDESFRVTNTHDISLLRIVLAATPTSVFSSNVTKSLSRRDRQFFPIKGVYTFALRVRNCNGNILSMVAVLYNGL